MLLCLIDLVANRLQQFREGGSFKDAAKLRAIIVNDIDVLDDHVINLLFAPLQIEPVIDGQTPPLAHL